MPLHIVLHTNNSHHCCIAAAHCPQGPHGRPCKFGLNSRFETCTGTPFRPRPPPPGVTSPFTFLAALRQHPPHFHGPLLPPPEATRTIPPHAHRDIARPSEIDHRAPCALIFQPLTSLPIITPRSDLPWSGAWGMAAACACAGPRSAYCGSHAHSQSPPPLLLPLPLLLLLPLPLLLLLLLPLLPVPFHSGAFPRAPG
jgi:hypothetical protein